MKIAALVAIGIVAAVSSQAAQPNEAPNKVDVCMQTGSDLFIIVPQAQRIAAQMFAGIGVTIQWHASGNACPSEAIHISLSEHTPENYSPGTLALAMPYEGTHIQIFYDRLIDAAKPRSLSSRLAHVMVHEITHILQGVARHSESGVMKAFWNQADYDEMAWKPLQFTGMDILLIQQGLDSRMAHAAAKVQNNAPLSNLRVQNPLP